MSTIACISCIQRKPSSVRTIVDNRSESSCLVSKCVQEECKTNEKLSSADEKGLSVSLSSQLLFQQPLQEDMDADGHTASSKQSQSGDREHLSSQDQMPEPTLTVQSGVQGYNEVTGTANSERSAAIEIPGATRDPSCSLLEQVTSLLHGSELDESPRLPLSSAPPAGQQTPDPAQSRSQLPTPSMLQVHSQPTGSSSSNAQALGQPPQCHSSSVPNTGPGQVCMYIT